jgi:hypothetical protein
VPAGAPLQIPAILLNAPWQEPKTVPCRRPSPNPNEREPHGKEKRPMHFIIIGILIGIGFMFAPLVLAAGIQIIKAGLEIIKVLLPVVVLGAIVVGAGALIGGGNAAAIGVGGLVVCVIYRIVERNAERKAQQAVQQAESEARKAKLEKKEADKEAFREREYQRLLAAKDPSAAAFAPPPKAKLEVSTILVGLLLLFPVGVAAVAGFQADNAERKRALSSATQQPPRPEPAGTFFYRYDNIGIGPFLTRQKALENCLAREKDVRRSLACDKSIWA